MRLITHLDRGQRGTSARRPNHSVAIKLGPMASITTCPNDKEKAYQGEEDSASNNSSCYDGGSVGRVWTAT